MNEKAATSQLDVRLAKAQALIDRGKQKRAVQELWYAEAQARGDANAIRELTDFTTAFTQRIEPRLKARLADLVAALEHDARQATPLPVSSPASLEGAPKEWSGAAFSLGLVLSLAVAAGASGLILFIWEISATMCPCSKQDFICIFGDPAISGAGAHLAGAGWGRGLLFGGIGLLIFSGYLVWQFRARVGHPFLSLMIGFPVFYGVLLASIWAVARGVWGPTRC